jgi:itaconate CoA-transferase
MRPLEGTTVVPLERAVATTFATRQLADLGARVIEVERPGTGDFARHHDQTVIRDFRATSSGSTASGNLRALDVKKDAARKVLEELLGEADVFVQNLAPGAAEHLGTIGWGSRT